MCCAEVLSHVWLFVTPWAVAHQAPWRFSRQEHWSGLPCPPLGDLPNPGIEPRSPAFQVDSLLSESPGKPKNTGVGSLFLLQGITPTHELNRGLLCCRQILYQLSYQGSPHVLFYHNWIKQNNQGRGEGFPWTGKPCSFQFLRKTSNFRSNLNSNHLNNLLGYHTDQLQERGHLWKDGKDPMTSGELLWLSLELSVWKTSEQTMAK